MDIEKKDFLFLDDFREACSPKYNKDYCLHILCSQGSAQFAIGEKQFNFVKSSAMVKSTGKPVSGLICSDDLDINALLISWRYLYANQPKTEFATIGALQTMDNPIIPLQPGELYQMKHDFNEIRYRLGHSFHGFFDEVLRRTVELMIFDFYDIQSRQRGTDVKGRGQATNILSRFIRLLQDGLVRDDRRVEYYASLLCISPKYLSEACITASGHNASYWIEWFTIRFLAQELRDTNKNMQEIADEYHFSSVSYFSRYVKERMKVSPSEYRRETLAHKNGGH